MLKLSSLADRRIRGDLTQFFIYKSGNNIINWKIAPIQITIRNDRLNDSEHYIANPLITKCDQREHFFTLRVTKHWNNLPASVTSVKSVNELQNKLDSHFHSTNSRRTN